MRFELIFIVFVLSAASGFCDCESIEKRDEIWASSRPESLDLKILESAILSESADLNSAGCYNLNRRLLSLEVSPKVVFWRSEFIRSGD